MGKRKELTEGPMNQGDVRQTYQAAKYQISQPRDTLVGSIYMSLSLKNLDDGTRSLMMEEVERDVVAGGPNPSKRFTPEGMRVYPDLLRKAIREGTDETLATDLRSVNAFAAQEPRTRNGKTSMVAVPYTAADTFAEGEFNRYYIRGVCRRAIHGGDGRVVVYRARASSSPRPESEAKIGAIMEAAKLLEDLRTNTGVDTALGLPTPNSGLSVALL